MFCRLVERATQEEGRQGDQKSAIILSDATMTDRKEEEEEESTSELRLLAFVGIMQESIQVERRRGA